MFVLARVRDLCIGICVCIYMVPLRYIQFWKALDSCTGRGKIHALGERMAMCCVSSSAASGDMEILWARS